MKKIFYIFMYFVLASSLYADAFKFMGGLNLLKYSISPEAEKMKWSYNPGLCIGAGVEFDITYDGKIAFELDGFMIQKKGELSEAVDQPEWKANYSLNALCLPALARIKFTVESPVYVLGGGELSIILSHKYTKKADMRDLKEDTRKLDYGLVFGFGIKKSLNDYQDFFIEARYHVGLLNILSNSWGSQSLKTNAVIILFGIKNY